MNKKHTQHLTAEQYHICREKGTERPFTSSLLEEHRAGEFACVCCGVALFSSAAKFDSGSGWPSFYAPLSPDVLAQSEDRSLGQVRTEVLCRACDAHLGHVFPDGPPPTGLRYCINGLALSFHPLPEQG